ncbi:hypothetical protein [Nannocystis sp. SCPEA4]|uniref:hypothetical protein n=1 Tax=Nannocystis sp. SCPEA4 TaxID=2996787 RepID=UPI00226F0EE6|nr:hypothetical protein [Nannocystis sp. SCPEA4]MCY1060645.1 hypothetical protein [Nannocystis sp. SCPEA4]
MTAARAAVTFTLLSFTLACGPSSDEPGATESTSGTGSDTSSSTDAPTTGEPAPVCMAGGGANVTLAWSQEALPDFVTALAGGPGEATVSVGVIADGFGGEDDDVFVEQRDAAGAVAWSDVYGGAHGEDDRVLDVAVDPAGFVHVLVQEVILNVIGESQFSTDARLVVLRYGPDGSHAWRWERAREPVEAWGSYVPEGMIGVAGEGIVVLEWAYDEPIVQIGLDSAGNLVSETTLAEAQFDHRIQADIGLDGSAAIMHAADPAGLWVARFDPAGASTWIDEFGGSDDKPGGVFAAEDGATYLVWSTGTPEGHLFHLRRFDADGGEAWTQELDLPSFDDRRIGGAVRCDGALVLVDSVGKPPQPDNEWGMRQDLWARLLAPDGSSQWTFEHEFGPPFSWGEGRGAAFTATGDVVVSATVRDGDGTTFRPWLGRISVE